MCPCVCITSPGKDKTTRNMLPWWHLWNPRHASVELRRLLGSFQLYTAPPLPPILRLRHTHTVVNLACSLQQQFEWAAPELWLHVADELANIWRCSREHLVGSSSQQYHHTLSGSVRSAGSDRMYFLHVVYRHVQAETWRQTVDVFEVSVSAFVYVCTCN